jgi:sulfur carrier protein
MLQLTINGEDRSFERLGHVAELVSVLGLDPRKVAVERNLEIVPRSAYAATPIADGDRIEIVHFIGGG